MPYPWSAGNVLTATDLNSALAAKTDTAMTQNAQTGTSYSYVLLDAAKLLTMNNAASNTVTVTKQATVTWVTGTQLRVMNLGAGVTTLVADTGVTINGNVALKQYQGGTLIRTASDVWTFLPNASAPPISASASVATSESTTSATYTDLSTAGPAVTLTTGTKALVIVTSTFANTAALGYASMGFAVSGATTLAADVSRAVAHRSTADFIIRASHAQLITSLTAGSNTFTAKYNRLSLGTSTFTDRNISVIDMGS